MTFEIALSGLNASSKQLSVISNNIANNTTTGFKSSRIEFADIFTSASKTAVGQGVAVTRIKQDFTPGNFTDTGNSLDMSINGQGFFRVVKDGEASYTRNGSFSINRAGFVVNADGHTLSGYQANEDGFLSPSVGTLRIRAADLAPNPTETIEFGLNLDSTMEVLPPFDVSDPGTYNSTTATTIFDSLGSPNVMTMYFRKDLPNSWTMYTYLDGIEISQPGGDEIVFDTDGALSTINGGASSTIAPPTFNPPSGGSPLDIRFDMSDITQYNGNFGVNQILQDGFANGRLNSLEVNDDGTIMGIYTNGQAQVMGQVTLTNFTNLDGLQQSFGSAWKETFASGSALTGRAGTASLGSIRSQSLEDSNVDITAELVSMISAQRSFQANAQVITTADTINQTVINMRR